MLNHPDHDNGNIDKNGSSQKLPSSVLSMLNYPSAGEEGTVGADGSGESAERYQAEQEEELRVGLEDNLPVGKSKSHLDDLDDVEVENNKNNEGPEGPETAEEIFGDVKSPLKASKVETNLENDDVNII